jgi:hypothetical protein
VCREDFQNLSRYRWRPGGHVEDDAAANFGFDSATGFGEGGKHIGEVHIG